MTESAKLLNLVIELSGVILCGMAILMLLIGPRIDRRVRRYFLICFGGCIALSASNMAGLLMRGLPGSGWRAALIASNYAEFLLPNLLTYLITHYLLSIVDGERKLTRLRRGMLALMLAHVALLTLSQFTGLYYVIGPDNIYRRRPLYPLSFLCSALMLLGDLALLRRYRETLSRKEHAVFLIYFMVPAVSLPFQAVQYGINFTVFSTIIAALVMYVFIANDQMERFEREQRENARQRASIMVLQMRPHFIYNTLMSIYYLCQQDAEKAQRVTLDFTTYLRKNFTAIAREGAIPFTEELEHTRAYLAVEQVRFEDKLFVEFDTPHTAFRLPPLTLQPIVENAVKHGVDPELEPLYISIRTQATERGNVVTVEDTGPGFAPTDDDTPHIALANIRERLETNGGGLEIAPRKAGGTVVTVVVP